MLSPKYFSITPKSKSSFPYNILLYNKAIIAFKKIKIFLISFNLFLFSNCPNSPYIFNILHFYTRILIKVQNCISLLCLFSLL